MRVALYARVSTVGQAEKNLSVPDQVRQLKAYCKQHKHDIIAEYLENGASATDDNRPKFKEMVDAIQQGKISVEAILVLTTSRFYRNALEAGIWKRQLRKYGVRVIAITQDVGQPDTPSGELVDGIFALIDQHESRMIGFHTARGMKENARKGYFNGSRPPYGYKVRKTADERGNVKGVLAIEEEEAAQVRQIFEMYTKQSWGAVEIAKVMNRDGFRRRKGAKWNQMEVLRVLENTTYIGKYVFGRFDSRNRVVRPESEWIVTSVPVIVDEETFNAAATLRRNKAKEWKNGRAYDGPLVLIGMLKCGKCGASMVSSTGKGGKYVYYTCRTYLKEGKTSCPGHRVPVQNFEKQIIDQILDWAFSAKNVKALVTAVRKALRERRGPVRELQAKVQDLEKRLARYYQAFEEGTMNPSDVSDRIGQLKAQKKEIEAELAERVSIKELPASISSPENIKRIQEDLRATLLACSPQTLKAYLKILVEDIVLDGSKVTIRAKSAGIMACLDQNEKLRTEGVAPVLNRVNKWRPQRDLNSCRRRERAVS